MVNTALPDSRKLQLFEATRLPKFMECESSLAPMWCHKIVNSEGMGPVQKGIYAEIQETNRALI